jgi:hypothetical protein
MVIHNSLTVNQDDYPELFAGKTDAKILENMIIY